MSESRQGGLGRNYSGFQGPSNSRRLIKVECLWHRQNGEPVGLKFLSLIRDGTGMMLMNGAPCREAW
jgi:hypothetical protein